MNQKVILHKLHYLDMQYIELKALLLKAEKEGRYVEAFAIRSMYVESIITTLSVAIYAHEKGFDGLVRSFAREVKHDPDIKNFYRTLTRMDLSDKIKAFRKLNKEGNQYQLRPTDFDKLFAWADTRNSIFHNFGEFMLNGTLKDKTERGYRHLLAISGQKWFSKIESGFFDIEKKLSR